MPHQFDRMCEIYRQARHIVVLSEGTHGAEVVATDTMKLIEELCTELARMTGKMEKWEAFKNSVK